MINYCPNYIIMYILYVLALVLFIKLFEARWSNGTVFEWRSRGLQFESYTDLKWTSGAPLHQISELIPRDDGVCVILVFLDAVRWLHMKPGVEFFPQGDQNDLVQLSGKANVKPWLNGWTAESGPTKTGSFYLLWAVMFISSKLSAISFRFCCTYNFMFMTVTVDQVCLYMNANC